MASTPVTSRIKTVEHELRIMEVEGAVRTEPSTTIELHDDVDVDSMPVVSELQSTLLGNADTAIHDPLIEERISAKLEPSSEVESDGSYSGPDPMGLLERIDSTQDVDDDEDEEESDEDSTASRRNIRISRWQIWMKRWPWFLHEDTDGEFAFCLYCNVVINVNKKSKYIQQHNLSLYHQERQNNYLAFKESKNQASESDDEVKHEFGTNEYVAAMKQRRAKEVDTLNDFNWKRWLKWHSWLERLQPVGTIGLCKCCNIRMNVEFVYLRKRHESSKGHCEAERQQKDTSSRKRKRSDSPIEAPVDTVSEPKSSSKKHPDDLTVLIDSGSIVDPGERDKWFERLENTHQCRCTLCDVRMSITSFSRHLKSKVHYNNLYDRKQNTIERGIWAQYADTHPWLVADPKDPSMAYCHVCSIRFMYGHSEIKRNVHAKSERHQANLTAFLLAEGDESATEENDAQTETEEFEAQSESDGSEGSDENYVEEDGRLSTSQKSSDEHTDEPAKVTRAKHKVRHYSWMRYSKDRKKLICKYCRVRIYNESSKLSHDQSNRHKKIMQKFKALKGKKSKKAKQQRSQDNEEETEDEDDDENEAETQEDEEQTSKNSTPADGPAENAYKASSTSNPKHKASVKTVLKTGPTTMQGKVLAWRTRFPWISFKRNEQRQNYVWCKLCNVSVFMPSCKFAPRHQRSSRHTRLRLERKQAEKKPASEGKSSAMTTTVGTGIMATGEAKQKAAIAELQAKYKWLEPDATDENRCFCKICDTRLPIKVFFLRQHDGSRKHDENLERSRNNSNGTTVADSREQPEANRMDVDLDRDQDSDEALSVKSECSTEEQTSSKRWRRTMELRRIVRILRESAGKRHEERSQLDMAKDMICSSFDIVKGLRALERETDLRELPSSSMIHSPAQPRDTIDLFFESITQTMKSLPPDLAAEGKAKIMQIVSMLELRAMQRTEPQLRKETPEKSSPTRRNSNHANEKSQIFEEIIDADSDSSSVVFEEQSDDPLEQFQSLLNKNRRKDIDHLSEITLTTTQRNAKSSPSPQTANKTVPTSLPTIIKGPGKDVPVNIRRILPSTVQVASKPDSGDQLRVVPINKLTAPNQYHNNARSNGNGVNSMDLQKLRSPNDRSLLSTPPSSNSSSHSDMNSGTPGVFHKIRLSNGTSAKVITIQKSPLAQQHLVTPQSQQQQQKERPVSVRQLPVRYSSGGSSLNSGIHLSQSQSQAVSQAQAQAQAQLRALSGQRPLARNGPVRPSQP
ncbi:hypothetical protein ACLKA6_002239 [Drosophila palustris]